MAAVSFDRVRKVFGDGTVALRELTLEVRDGELLVLLGPSGCGKSTALRVVAGLDDVTSGEVAIGGRRVNDVPAAERDVAMVFQNYALYPHLTVRQNLSFALETAKVARDEIRARVDRVALLLGLGAELDRKPDALSGGQRQRVAMGRALVREPSVLLMDEPLLNLDAAQRHDMRTSITQLQHRLGATTLYVTHDQVEAMSLGDRVAVLSHGVLHQVADPATLYDRPADLFVASFVGSPGMNLVAATLEAGDGGRAVARFGRHALALDATCLAAHPRAGAYLGRRVVLGLRPEDLVPATADHPDDRCLDVAVEGAEALGPETHVHVDVDVPPVVVDGAPRPPAAGGPTFDGTRLTARVPGRVRVRLAESIRLAARTEHAHLFDPDDGRPLR